MSRVVPILCVTCVVGIGLTAWSKLAAGEVDVAIPKVAPTAGAGAAGAGTTGAGATGTEEDALATVLLEARRACSVEALDAAVERLRAATAAMPEGARAWHLLAEAHLERAQQRTHLRGLKVGKPTFEKLPQALDDDLDRGLEAVAKARELGDDSGALYRIEASLMTQKITGIGSALQWTGKIEKALTAAGERGAEDPALHVALGARKLFAPRFFGHDPEKALEHFEYAVKGGQDERPAVFAAMASFLQKKRQQAIGWLERAVERNPNNRFARVVLGRLRRGEDDPFGRDVSEAELAAGK